MTPLVRHYTLRTLGLTAAIVLSVGALNLGVDPYNYFGWNRLGVYISAEREAKANLVRQQPHDALLVGTSRAAMIPVRQLQGYHFFNGAFGGAALEEIEEFIRRFARAEKLVLLAVDLGMCASPQPLPDRFAPWQAGDILEKTLSLKTVEYSVRTIASHLRHAPPHLIADGSFVPDRWFELYDHERPSELRWKMEMMQRSIDAFNRPPAERMQPFRRIAQTLAERNIASVVFIPPMHEAIVPYLLASTNRPYFEAWKTELRSIFPRLLDFSTGPWSKADNFFKADPVHFKPQVGADLINQEILAPRSRSAAAGGAGAGYGTKSTTSPGSSAGS
jgi:hypothetical protein